MSHWSVNGDRRAHVPCSPSSVYHVAVNDNSDSKRVSTKYGSTLVCFKNHHFILRVVMIVTQLLLMVLRIDNYDLLCNF